MERWLAIQQKDGTFTVFHQYKTTNQAGRTEYISDPVYTGKNEAEADHLVRHLFEIHGIQY